MLLLWNLIKRKFCWSIYFFFRLLASCRFFSEHGYRKKINKQKRSWKRGKTVLPLPSKRFARKLFSYRKIVFLTTRTRRSTLASNQIRNNKIYWICFHCFLKQVKNKNFNEVWKWSDLYAKLLFSFIHLAFSIGIPPRNKLNKKKSKDKEKES